MHRLLAAALLAAPLLAHAENYRCKQPDGSTAFQDHACAAGAKGATYAMPAAQGYAAPPSARPRAEASADDPEAARAKAQLNAYTAQIEAANKATRCRAARRDLAVLQEQVRVYRRDDNGKRDYIDDKDRPAAIAQSREAVDDNCEQ